MIEFEFYQSTRHRKFELFFQSKRYKCKHRKNTNKKSSHCRKTTFFCKTTSSKNSHCKTKWKSLFNQKTCKSTSRANTYRENTNKKKLNCKTTRKDFFRNKTSSCKKTNRKKTCKTFVTTTNQTSSHRKKTCKNICMQTLFCQIFEQYKISSTCAKLSSEKVYEICKRNRNIYIKNRNRNIYIMRIYRNYINCNICINVNTFLYIES